ncbi:hypothetical protein E4U41_002087 [Claviceps citrina]|nr:hypothetical protein E4U41_002087 [Claviceps citrina]
MYAGQKCSTHPENQRRINTAQWACWFVGHEPNTARALLQDIERRGEQRGEFVVREVMALSPLLSMSNYAFDVHAAMPCFLESMPISWKYAGNNEGISGRLGMTWPWQRLTQSTSDSLHLNRCERDFKAPAGVDGNCT